METKIASHWHLTRKVQGKRTWMRELTEDDNSKVLQCHKFTINSHETVDVAHNE